jgi:hypothetical protein
MLARSIVYICTTILLRWWSVTLCTLNLFQSLPQFREHRWQWVGGWWG